MPRNPCGVGMCEIPAFQKIDHKVRVVFGDVVEVVGDGFADVEAGISFEIFEDRAGEGGVVYESFEAEGPRETWA